MGVVRDEKDEFDEELEGKVSEFRNISSQCLAAVATNLLKFSFGTFIGFNTIFISELYKPNAEINITLDELSWFSSYCFMSPIGAVSLGILTQHLGCRSSLAGHEKSYGIPALLMAATSFSASRLVFHYAISSTMLLATQALLGLTLFTAVGQGMTYVAESSQPRLRGVLMASSYLCVAFGIFFATVIGSFLHWRTAALANLVFPVLGFPAVYLVPDSLHWLASKGRFKEAELALAWPRGWTTPAGVRSEFLALKAAHSSSKLALLGRAEISNGSSSSSIRSFCRSLALIRYIFLAHALTGSESIQDFAALLFRKIEAPLDEHAATVAFMGLRVIGTGVCICAIRAAGKRNMLFVSLALAATAYAIAALVIHSRTRGESSELSYWLPAAMLVLSTFATSMGLDKIVNMLNSELFPAQYRNVGVGLGKLVSSTCSALANKMFLYAIDEITVQGLFLFCAPMCVLALVTFYFVVPETEGRSLEEIERRYDRVDAKSKRVEL